jgi:hypothetical protein
VFFISLTFLIPGFAEVYRSVDENGNVVYTDKPSPDAEKIKIDKVQTIPAGPDNFKYTPPEKPDLGNYTKLEIASPENNHVFTGNIGEVNVSVTIKPALRESDSFVFYMDGKKQGDSSSPSFQMTNLDRGTHTVKVDVVNQDGKSLKSSSAVSFTVKRTSALNPNRLRAIPHAN